MNLNNQTTIAKHLVRRFHELGIDQGFGIVGDFALRLFGRLHEEGFSIRVTADEQGAGFAADAYARIKGFGVCAVTYSVGGFKVVNATAGAWAEQVPILVISGSPGIGERKNDPLLHHKVKNFDTQLRVFEDITVSQAFLDNPLTTAAEIDRVLSTIISQQRPGYIEIPRDMVDIPILDIETPLSINLPPVDKERLAVAVQMALDMLTDYGDAVILAGVMVARRNLGATLKAFSEQFSIPFATTSLSKGIVSERHPLALGVYMGAVSPQPIVNQVESAKPLIMLGVLYADLVMGGFTDNLNREHVIESCDDHTNIGLHTFKDVPLWAFLPALVDAASKKGHREGGYSHQTYSHYLPTPDKELSVEKIMACVSSNIDEFDRLLIDPGDCLFASVDILSTSYSLASAYYASMGYAVPAALGAGLADRRFRPIVLVGDGAFLMTALETLHSAYHGLNPIIVIVDNKGYGTQRPMLDGPFNDIPLFKSELLTLSFGFGKGFVCATENDFHQSFLEAKNTDQLCIIRACVPQHQYSPALVRLTNALKKKV